MAVIKSTQTSVSLSPFSLADIEDAAKRILLRARKQADDLLLQAQKESAAMKAVAKTLGSEIGRREGYAAGLTEGKTAGHNQALAENRENFTKLLAALTKATAELDARRYELETDAIHEVIELALAIAQRVTKRQGLQDSSVLIANVTEALSRVVHWADVRIAIHPREKVTLTDALANLQSQWPALKHVELVEDAKIAPGGCRLYTQHGNIDAELDTQLRNIAAEIAPEK